MDHAPDHGNDLQHLEDLRTLAARRADILNQLSAGGVELIHLPRCPAPSAPDYPVRTLTADLVCLQHQLLAGLPDPEHRH